MKNKFLLFGVVLMIWSCSSKQVEQDVTSNLSLQNMDLGTHMEIDTIAIDIDETKLPYYKVFSLNDANSNEFFGYNAGRNAIDIFDIRKQEHVKSIVLDNQGPDGVNDVRAMKVLDDKSIFIVTFNFLLKLNSDGKVLSRKNIIAGNDFFSEYNLYPHNSTSLLYEKSSKSLISGSIKITVSPSSQPEKFYRTSNIVAKLSEDALSAESIPLPYPAAYSQDYFGFLDDPYIALNNGKVYASFPAVSDISCFDLKNEELQIIEVNAKMTENKATPLNWSDSKRQDKKMTHFTRSHNYGPILFLDDERFVRIVVSELPSDLVDLRNAFANKKIILEYVDLKSNSIEEIVLEHNKVNYFWSFVSEGELFMPTFSSEESQLKFLKVSIG